MRFLFEDYVLDLDRRELLRAGKPVSIAPQVFDLLAYLIHNRDRIVTKNDLVNAIWSGRAVSDAALTTRLSIARRAIGDSGRKPNLIKTLQRRGFRFIGQVQEQKTDFGVRSTTHWTDPGTTDKPSIAVLPFQNMSGDPDQEYFADGMVEDIITALSRFKSLLVIARNSSFTYKGRTIDIKHAGKELGARYLLEGSVRKAGGRVRITAQLMETVTGAHLWANKFDGVLKDIFDFQDSITATVVSAIAPRVSQAEIERTRLKRPENLDSHDYVLRAQSAMRPPTAEGLRAAIDQLDTALALLPHYPLAHGLVAECYASLEMLGAIKGASEVTTALKFARSASELGREDPEALAGAAFALSCFDSVAASARMIERALELNENLARAWSLMGFAQLYLANHGQSLASFHRALRLNPTDVRNPTVMGGIATVHYVRCEYDLALHWAEKALSDIPTTMQGLRAMAMSAAQLGQHAKARGAAETLKRLFPANLARIRKMMTRQSDIDTITQGLRLAGYVER